MPRIDFPLGLEGSEDLPQTRRDLVNCFNNGENRLIGRPGIESLNTSTGVARANFSWNDKLYQVQSERLVEITNVETGAFTDIGVIEGTEPVEVDFGFNDAALVVRGGKIYALSNSTIQIAISGVTDSSGVARFTHAGTDVAVGNTVTLSGFVTNTAYNATGVVTAAGAGYFEISSIAFDTDETGQFTLVLSDISGNSNFVPCVDVCHINGRFVYVPANGDPAFFTDVGAVGTVQSTSFFDAEELPDKNNACFNGKNTLFICGTDSIEQFRDTGADPNPFVRISGSRILNGVIGVGGVQEYNNTFLFLGREKDQDPGIFSIVQGGAAKMSNERIDLILSTYTETELKNITTGRFKWRGNDIATFTLGNDSFGFFGGHWFLLSTIDTNNTEKPWRAGYITEFNGTYYTAFSTRIGKLAKINTDYGQPIHRVVDMAFDEPEGNFFTCQSIEFGISQGYNSQQKPVGICMTRDNVTYGPTIFKNLGKIGDYAMKLKWNPPGGLGNYEGFMGVRFFTRENVEFNVDKIIAKFR